MRIHYRTSSYNKKDFFVGIKGGDFETGEEFYESRSVEVLSPGRRLRDTGLRDRVRVERERVRVDGIVLSLSFPPFTTPPFRVSKDKT